LNYTGKPCRLNQSQLEKLKIYVKEGVSSSAKQEVSFVRSHFRYGFFIASAKLTYKKPKLIPGKANEEAKVLFPKNCKS